MAGAFLLFLTLAYLLGSIPFGKLVSHHHGVDIQKHGSGNIGFANVQRTLGWKPGLVVLAADIIKGFLPVFIAKNYLTDYQIMAVALLAMLGHIFPIWLKFKGGKGIATGLGITLAINLLLGSLAVAVYLVSLAIFRKSGPSSITAAWSLPLLSLLIVNKYVWFYLLLAVIATRTHRTNLRDIRNEILHAG